MDGDTDAVELDLKVVAVAYAKRDSKVISSLPYPTITFPLPRDGGQSVTGWWRWASCSWPGSPSGSFCRALSRMRRDRS
jgi:hypothetical protein